MYLVDELIQTCCNNKGIRSTPESMEQLREYYEQHGYTCSLGLTCSALNYDSKTVEILRGDVDCIPGKGVK